MDNCLECNSLLQFLDISKDGYSYFLCPFCNKMFRQNESKIEEVKSVCIREPRFN